MAEHILEFLEHAGAVINLFAVAVIAIRTALGWSMVLEMYGHWPWQRKKRSK